MCSIVVKCLDCGIWEASMKILSLPTSSVSGLCNLSNPSVLIAKTWKNDNTEKDRSLGCLGPHLPGMNDVSKI